MAHVMCISGGMRHDTITQPLNFANSPVTALQAVVMPVPQEPA